MKTVVYISNVAGSCRVWTSESRRLEGFRRYLPEEGWRLASLVKACNCGVGNGTKDERSATQVDGHGGLTRESGRVGVCTEDVNGLMWQLACAPRLPLGLWLKLARWSGWGFGDAVQAREVFHLVHPYPEFAEKRHNKGWPKSMGRLLAVLTGRALRLVEEQDRIDWVERGTNVAAGIVRRLSADVVVGSFPGIQNLRIAAAVARETGRPWIADFRDSVNGGWCCSPRQAKSVARIVRTAGHAFYTSDGYRLQDRDVFAGGTTIIENGFLDEECSRARAKASCHGKVFVIRFVGTVYPQRNLRTLLDGMRRHLEANPSDAGLLRFEYFGPTADRAEEDARATNMLRWCSLSGSVPAEEALQLCADATVLALPTNTCGQTGVPGAKFYEYLGVCRPILAAGGIDPYVTGVLRETGAGAMCQDAEEVARVLAQWVQVWRESGKVPVDVRGEALAKQEGQRPEVVRHPSAYGGLAHPPVAERSEVRCQSTEATRQNSDSDVSDRSLPCPISRSDARPPASRFTFHASRFTSNVSRLTSHVSRSFGFVGRLVAGKGILETVEALRLLRDKGVEPAFTFVGDGPLIGELQASVARHKLTNVTVAGVLTPRESVARMDVLVLASESEAMPLVLVEALSARHPCIATAVGGIPDLIRDGVEGFLLADHAPATIAAAIERFLKMPSHEFAGFTERARRRYEECCTPEAVGEVVVGHYRGIEGDRRPKTAD